MSQLQIEVSLNTKGCSPEELSALKATVSTLEEVFQFITDADNASYQEQFSMLMDKQACLNSESASFEGAVCSEDQILVPLEDEDKIRFVVVDAVEKSRHPSMAEEMRKQMEFIGNHYPNCIVLKVTSVPDSVSLQEDRAVLGYIQGAWAEFVAKSQDTPHAARRRAFWLQALKTPSSWLSVSNFVLIAASALSTALFLAWLNPEILAAAAPALVGTGMVALAVGAVVFPFFAAWKMYEHYNAWRFEACSNNTAGFDFSYNDYLKINAKTGWSKYNAVQEEENQKVVQALEDEKISQASFRQKISYGHYLRSLGTQLWTWGEAHKAQAALVTVGLILSAVLIGFGVGFFLGDPLSVAILSPMLDLVNNVLSVGLTSLGQMPGLEFLAPLFTTYIGQIVGVILTAALPLIIMDGIRRLADTVWKGQQAGGEPLLMVEDNFKKGYDATIPEHNEDLSARAAAGAFWGEVGKEIKEKVEKLVGPQYQQIS